MDVSCWLSEGQKAEGPKRVYSHENAGANLKASTFTSGHSLSSVREFGRVPDRVAVRHEVGRHILVQIPCNLVCKRGAPALSRGADEVLLM